MVGITTTEPSQVTAITSEVVTCSFSFDALLETQVESIRVAVSFAPMVYPGDGRFIYSGQEIVDASSSDEGLRLLPPMTDS